MIERIVNAFIKLADPHKLVEREPVDSISLSTAIRRPTAEHYLTGGTLAIFAIRLSWSAIIITKVIYSSFSHPNRP